MSLESYVMAILDVHQNLPDNHTYTDLIEGLEKVITVKPELKARILKYKNIHPLRYFCLNWPRPSFEITMASFGIYDLNRKNGSSKFKPK